MLNFIHKLSNKSIISSLFLSLHMNNKASWEAKNNNVKVYEKGLTKSRQGFVSRLADLTNRYKKVTDEYFDELEEILIMADIGVNTVMEFIDRLRDRVRSEKLDDPEMLKELIVDELFIIYVNDSVLTSKLTFREDGITPMLFVGVNGVGKTTTCNHIKNNRLIEKYDIFAIDDLENVNNYNNDTYNIFYENANFKGCDTFTLFDHFYSSIVNEMKNTYIFI